MTSLLPSSLQNSLQDILQQANLRGASIRAILLSTTDGVPLGRVPLTNTLNEEVLASIESVWAPASKQFPVLGLEKVKQVTAIYDHGSLIHVYQAPMVRCTLDARRGPESPLCCAQMDESSLLLTYSLFVSLFWHKGSYDFMWSPFESRSHTIHGDSFVASGVGTIVARIGELITARYRCVHSIGDIL